MSWKIAVTILVVYVSVTLAFPECVCPAILDPVCGSDGQTYSNNCLLECEQANKSVFPIHKGPCDDPEKPCVCGFDYRPVCGTDGKTYSNKCEFNCSKAKSFVLDIQYEGDCH